MTTARTLRHTLPLLGAGLALALTACGSAGSKDDAAANGFAQESGSTIAKAALKDLSGVKVVRLSGHMTIDGGPITFDFRTDARGTCGGTMGLGGGEAKIVATKDAAFLKGDDAFWKEQAGNQAAQVQTMLAGRWAKTPPSSQITALCELGKGLASQVSSGDLSSSKVGKVSTLDGVDVVTVTSGTGKEKYQLVVEVAAPHHLRKLVSLTPGDEGELAFSDFGNKKPVDVPTAGDYVDLKK